MIWYHKISMDIYFMWPQQLLCVWESAAIFICASAQFTQGKRAETVICSAVVANSSSRLDSFTTFSSQQSPTCLIVDLSDVWELYFWPNSSRCVCVCVLCFSPRGVCMCELNRCSSLPLASGVSECFHHFLSLLSAANSPARCNDSNSYNALIL